jgi:hypothetical protein
VLEHLETIIKSPTLQLSLKARANQVIEVEKSEFKVRSSNSKFQVRFSVDRLTQSGNFEKLVQLNQSLLPKKNLILMDCSISVQI